MRFFKILSFLETRLDIIVLRSGFYTKLSNAQIGIKKKLITVNGQFKNVCLHISISLVFFFNSRIQSKSCNRWQR